jgi:hypothetical protein
MCHLIWLLSRKYGTVWYHPASSKLWYLIALSFVNFQEKLTGTSFALCACEASFVRLAVCLALSALFASTYTKMYISLYLCSPLNDMRTPLVSIFFLLSSSHLPPSSSHPCVRGAGPAAGAGRRGGRPWRADLVAAWSGRASDRGPNRARVVRPAAGLAMAGQ